MQSRVFIATAAVSNDRLQVGPPASVVNVDAVYDVRKQRAAYTGARGFSGSEKNELVVVANDQVAER